jgi:hypothetical protein
MRQEGKTLVTENMVQSLEKDIVKILAVLKML